MATTSTMTMTTPMTTTPSGDHEERSDCNLIVNYLPWMMSQEEVRRLFSRVGTVDTCRLVKDKRTGQSLGYAFVRYRSRLMAKRAIETFNGFRIQNKIIKVSIARPRCSRLRGANVYVSGLDRSMTSVDLDELFRPFGKIISCRVLCDERTGLSRGVAFVLFNLRSEAEEAIRRLNATIPNGAKQPIRLKFATRPTIAPPTPRLLWPLTTTAPIALTLPHPPIEVTLPHPPIDVSYGGQVMNTTQFLGPTRLATPGELAAIVRLANPDHVDVIRCNLATTNCQNVVYSPMNQQRSADLPVSRQVASATRKRNRLTKGDAKHPDGGDQHQNHQPLLDSEQELEDEEEMESMESMETTLPGSPSQSTIVVRSDDVDERLWRLFGPLATTVSDIQLLQGDDRPAANIEQTTVVQESIVTTGRSGAGGEEEATMTIRTLENSGSKLGNSNGEQEVWMRDAKQQQQQQQQQQQHGSCDGWQLLKEFDQSFNPGKDFDVCQGQGQGQGPLFDQTTSFVEGRIVDNNGHLQITDLEMDEGLMSGLVTTPQCGFSICRGQAIDGRLWTNNVGGGYASPINPTMTNNCCWLNHLKSSHGFCCCNQPTSYFSISPQDMQTTFHLSCS